MRALCVLLLLHLVTGQDLQQYLDPNQEVYREIYEDSLHGRIPLENEDHSLQQMYTQLFQTAPNRVQGPSLLDSCPTITPASTSVLPKSSFFFSLNHGHLAAMHQVKAALLQEPDSRSMICAAARLRESSNRHAWVRGVVSAAMSRPDTAGLSHPPLEEMLPSLQIPAPVIQQARRAATAGRCQATVDGSLGQVNGVENKLWYFREDVQINSNHWFWHLSNPFSHVRLEVPTSPRPDRRGELFYFFHRGILARYHAERLANGMGDVVPLYLKKGTILKEQYYAFLTDANSARNWTDRGPNTKLEDLVSNRDFISHPANISIEERSEYLSRIEAAIRRGALIDRSGRPVTLDSTSGIDLLSEAVEASIYSINPDYYSEFGIHNDGHFLIGLVADPDDVLQLPPSVMADGATAMRDPLFYTYHNTIDEVFEMHKQTLEPYRPSRGEWPLAWPGAEVVSLHVQQDNSPPNLLTTFINERQVNLVRGLDFNRSDSNGSVYACVKHLDHEPFEYLIGVNWKQRVGSYGATRQPATVRIFLAPRYDLRKRRYSMTEQRKLFFPLDHFRTELKPGPNMIRRKSSDSTLTIPWPQPFEELERDSSTRLTPYCGCGWPEHMLLPRGTGEGQVYDLFVMVTDGDQDKVQSNSRVGRPLTKNGCRPAHLYCGVANQAYPDARPMNYPFDRGVYRVEDHYLHGSLRAVRNLDEYSFGIPNIGTVEVTVRHQEEGPGHGFGGSGPRLPTFGQGLTKPGFGGFPRPTAPPFGGFHGDSFGSGTQFGNFGPGFGGGSHFGSSSSSSSSSYSFGSYGR